MIPGKGRDSSLAAFDVGASHLWTRGKDYVGFELASGRNLGTCEGGWNVGDQHVTTYHWCQWTHDTESHPQGTGT